MAFSFGVARTWGAQPLGSNSFEAKGDLLAGTANGAFTRLPVGPAGQVLMSVPANPTGLGYAAIGAMGGGAPTKADKNETPMVTAGDASPTGVVIANTPVGDRYVTVTVNGIGYVIGDGATNLDCYLSNDGGATARFLAAVVAGDELIWNGVVAGFDLGATDKISLDYDV